VSQINQNDGNKLHELGDELLPHPPYSPDLALSDLFLFADLKKMHAGKNFSTKEEVIAETEAYFEAMSKSSKKNGNFSWEKNIKLLRRDSELSNLLVG
jgi:hypothetical protein